MSEKMGKFIKQVIILAICVITTGLGASLTMKAALGIGAYDAAAMSVSKLTIIKVGTIGMCANLICVMLQISLLGKKFRILQLLQIGVAVLLGMVVNFFLYSLLGNITITNYVVRLIVLLLGYVICAFSVGVIMSINIVSMPLEGFCMVLSQKINKNFGRIRQSADIISICVVIILTLVFKVQLTLREGTVVGMIIFGPMMDKFIRMIKPTLVKFDLV